MRSNDNVGGNSRIIFKWIKQHLRIKAFYGTSDNAVKVQIWVAISVYALVAIVKKEMKLQSSLYEILQILSLTIFEKSPVFDVLNPEKRKFRIANLLTS
jgi:hypothetical protein